MSSGSVQIRVSSAHECIFDNPVEDARIEIIGPDGSVYDLSLEGYARNGRFTIRATGRTSIIDNLVVRPVSGNVVEVWAPKHDTIREIRDALKIGGEDSNKVEMIKEILGE